MSKDTKKSRRRTSTKAVRKSKAAPPFLDDCVPDAPLLNGSAPEVYAIRVLYHDQAPTYITEPKKLKCTIWGALHMSNSDLATVAFAAGQRAAFRQISDMKKSNLAPVAGVAAAPVVAVDTSAASTASDEKVLANATQSLPSPPHCLSHDRQRVIEVGDLVHIDGHESDWDGEVIGILKHDHHQGDLCIYRDQRGNYGAWFATDLNIIRKGPLPMPSRERIVTIAPGFGDPDGIAAAAKFLKLRHVHDDEDENEPATLPAMRTAVQTVGTAKQLLQQIESLIITPLCFTGGIGWQWADSTAADWSDAFIRALRVSLEDLETSANCAIARAANDEAAASIGTGAAAATVAHALGRGEAPAEHAPLMVPWLEASDAVERVKAVDERQWEEILEFARMVRELSMQLIVLQRFMEKELDYVDCVSRSRVLSLSEALRRAMSDLLAATMNDFAFMEVNDFERIMENDRQRGIARVKAMPHANEP